MKFKIEFDNDGDKTIVEGDRETWPFIADRFYDALLGAGFVLKKEMLATHFDDQFEVIGNMDKHDDTIWLDELNMFDNMNMDCSVHFSDTITITTDDVK